MHTFTCPCAQVIDLDGKERENKESVQALLLMLDKSLLPTQALHGLVSLNSALEWMFESMVVCQHCGCPVQTQHAQLADNMYPAHKEIPWHEFR